MALLLDYEHFLSLFLMVVSSSFQRVIYHESCINRFTDIQIPNACLSDMYHIVAILYFVNKRTLHKFHVAFEG